MLCSLQLKIHKQLQTRHDYTQIIVVTTGVDEIQGKKVQQIAATVVVVYLNNKTFTCFFHF